MPGQIAHRFLNGPLVDQVFADQTATGNILWYLFDHQNTVRDVAVFDGTPGDQAEVVNHLTYNSAGSVVSADNPQTATANDGDLPGLSGTGNEYSPQRSYTGREPDAVTGLIYYRTRWYDPRLGRFISEDPIGFAAGDANLRRYVGNSMPNAVDPTGLEELEFEVLDFGRSNVGGPKVQYQGEIMFPEVALWLQIPGSDYSDTYYRPNAKVVKVGTWLVTPYFARDPDGKEYIRYYLAQTHLYDHPASRPRVRAAWIIPPNRVIEFATGDRSKYEFMETWAYGTSDHLTPGQAETFATRSILPLAKEELKRQWTDPVLVTQCIAGTVMALPARTPSGVAASGSLRTSTSRAIVSSVDDVAAAGNTSAANQFPLRTNAQLVDEIGNRARMWGQRTQLTGTPREIGTKQHKYARDLLDRYQQMFGNRNLITERSFILGTEVPYGTSESVRIDVLDVMTGDTWDYKFGTTPMSKAQIQKILKHGPGVTSVSPVYKP